MSLGTESNDNAFICQTRPAEAHADVVERDELDGVQLVRLQLRHAALRGREGAHDDAVHVAPHEHGNGNAVSARVDGLSDVGDAAEHVLPEALDALQLCNCVLQGALPSTRFGKAPAQQSQRIDDTAAAQHHLVTTTGPS